MDKTVEKKQKIRKKIKNKKKPVIRGHFGKRSIRKKSKAKWNKWRAPRGIDFKLKKEDGKKPGSGRRTSKEIRGLHPSGAKEVLVNSILGVENAKKENAIIRIERTIGKRKRNEIIKKAGELKIKVINA